MAAPTGSPARPPSSRLERSPSLDPLHVEDKESFKAFLTTLLLRGNLDVQYVVDACWKRHFPSLEVPGSRPHVLEGGKPLKRAFIDPADDLWAQSF